jgi:hypothetical protein
MQPPTFHLEAGGFGIAQTLLLGMKGATTGGGELDFFNLPDSWFQEREKRLRTGGQQCSGNVWPVFSGQVSANARRDAGVAHGDNIGSGSSSSSTATTA